MHSRSEVVEGPSGEENGDDLLWEIQWSGLGEEKERCLQSKYCETASDLIQKVMLQEGRVHFT